MKSLLEHGAHPDKSHKFLPTALEIARNRGDEEIVALLLSYNATPSPRRNYLSPFEGIPEGSRKNVFLGVLRNHAMFGYSDQYEELMLYLATAIGYSEMVKSLLGGDTGDDLLQENKYMILSVAADHGHADIMGVFLEKTTDIQAFGVLYDDAIQKASAKGHEKVVDLLIDKATKCGKLYEAKVYPQKANCSRYVDILFSYSHSLLVTPFPRT